MASKRRDVLAIMCSMLGLLGAMIVSPSRARADTELSGRVLTSPGDFQRWEDERRTITAKTTLSIIERTSDFLATFTKALPPPFQRAAELVGVAAAGGGAGIQGVPLDQALGRVIIGSGAASIGGILGTLACGPPLCTAIGATAGGAAADKLFQMRDQRAVEVAAKRDQQDGLAMMARDWTRNTPKKYPNEIFTTKPSSLLARQQTANIVGSGASHIGAPATLGVGRQTTEARPGGLQEQSTGIESRPLRVVEGNAATHLGTHARYGTILAPGGVMQSINNADLAEVVAVKEYIVGKTGGVFTFQSLANFVTTEYPDFVGTQFNDTATITVRTQAGQSATFTARQLFQASVNGSQFSPVSGLPAPLAGFNDNDGGGQTGFRSITARANVAPGSRVIVEFRVRNVGDTAFPSALLLSAPRR